MVKDPAKVSIKVEGIRELSRDAIKFGVSLSDMTQFNMRMAKPIQTLAKQLAPRGKTGKLVAGIKPIRSKLSISVAVGSEKLLPYAGVVHYGYRTSPGNFFLSEAERKLRAKTLAGYDKEIQDLLRKQGWV